MIYPCPKGVDPKRWRQMSSGAQRRALRERPKSLTEEVAPMAPVNKRPDGVIAKAKEYGIKPMELDAYDLIAKTAATSDRAPSQIALATAAGSENNNIPRAVDTLYRRLEKAGLIKTSKTAAGMTRIVVQESGLECFVVPNKARRKMEAA